MSEERGRPRRELPEQELREGWAPSTSLKAVIGGAGPLKAEASPMRPPPPPSDAASSAKPPGAKKP